MQPISSQEAARPRWLPGVLIGLCATQPLLDVLSFWTQTLGRGTSISLALRMLLLAAAAVLAALCVLASNRHRIPELTVYGVWTFVFAAGTFLLQLAVHRSVFD